MDKRLVAVGAILIAAGIVIVVIVCAKWSGGNDDDNGTVEVTKQPQETCQTPACATWADAVTKSMDTSVEPCDNFYKFACGNFIKITNIPDYAAEVDEFSITRYSVEQQLRALVEEPIGSNELGLFKKIKLFYNDCLNTERIEEIGLNVIKKHIEDAGGWPTLEGDKWNESNFNWPTYLHRFNKLGFNSFPLFTISVQTDLKNNSRRIIYVDVGKFFSGTVGRADKSVQAYSAFMVELAIAYGAEPKTAMQDAEDALDLEILLARHRSSHLIRPNLTQLYNVRTIAQLEREYPSIPWLECINSILPEGISVGRVETVILTEPKFFKYLEHLMMYTKKRVMANYLVWHTVSTTAMVFTKELADIYLKYINVLKGVTQMPERWQSCLGYIKPFMGNQASAMYVRKYVSPKAKSEVTVIMKYVQKEFEEILRGNNWMDDETKYVALDKFKAMKQDIAYPQELLDDDYLMKTYGNVEIIPGEFFTSLGNIKRFNEDLKNKRLREPINKTEWITPAITVNAFYKMVKNALVVPAAILQGQFFDHERPRYMNFGSLGFIIGHEITHGFDDIGRQFDSEGNFKDLWTVNTKRAFLKKVKCFINQYDSYTVPEVNLTINGVKTQGENIADNGGALEAYLAYQTWQEENPPEPLLPGVNYTQNQMFWISLAQVWCNTSRLKKLHSHILQDPHSPYEYRIIGAFSNLKEFSRDFNCPLHSPMNPEYKCKLW